MEPALRKLVYLLPLEGVRGEEPSLGEGQGGSLGGHWVSRWMSRWVVVGWDLFLTAKLQRFFFYTKILPVSFALNNLKYSLLISKPICYVLFYVNCG